MMAEVKRSRVKVLACTGGIGSGKTYVCRIFEHMGIPVYYSDDRAKALYGNPVVREKVKALFGQEIYRPYGSLDGKALAAVVFNDAQQLLRLEEVIHPAVKADFLEWKDAAAKKMADSRFPVIIESAIILEKPLFRELADAVVTVTAPEALRISRVMLRDGVTEEMVKSRMECQMNEAERIKLSDFVIFADNQKALLPQMHEVLDKMI